MNEATATTDLAVGLAGLRPFSDERLVRRAIEGDERAFAGIYRRYHRDLSRYLLAILGNREDAADALQATMVKAIRALPGERREITLKPWLYRIAHNEAIDLVRRRRANADPLVPEIATRDPQPYEEVEQRVRLRRLLDDLDDLPARQRSALVMRELSGLDFEEIATTLGTSPAVVRQALYEARLSLRQMEAGRELSCDAVTGALSDTDGRIGRRRDLRAHLRECRDCRQFRQAMKERRTEFRALAPLPALAAAAVFKSTVGGVASGGAGATASGLGGALGASVVIKSAATIATVTALGVAAADREGLIDLPLPAIGGVAREAPTPAAPLHDSGAPASSPQGTRAAGHPAPAATGAGAPPVARGKSHAASHPTGASHHAPEPAAVGAHGKPAATAAGGDKSSAGTNGQATAEEKKSGAGGAGVVAGSPPNQAPLPQTPEQPPPPPEAAPGGGQPPATGSPPQIQTSPPQQPGGSAPVPGKGSPPAGPRK